MACQTLYTAGDPVVVAEGFPLANADEFIRQMLDLLMRWSLYAVKEMKSAVTIYRETM